MRLKRRILLASVLSVAAFIVAFLLWPSNEPSYNGKSLRQWLEQNNNSADPRLLEEARTAILHIGSNAIPTLISMTAMRDSSLKSSIRGRFRDADLIGSGGPLARYLQRPFVDPILAASGFEVLGPAASNAVPDLAHIVRTTDNSTGRAAAIFSIGYIGLSARAALPELINELITTHSPMVESEFGGTVDAISSIACEDGKWQPDCLRALLPALTGALKNTNAANFRVLRMLEKIGPDAKSAIPAIQPYLTSTNSEISILAAAALESIDPDASIPTIK